MNSKTIEQIVIESLEPTFTDFVKDETSKYWYGYEEELAIMKVVLNRSQESLIEEINETLKGYYSSNGEYNAALDVASTLEALCPEKYAGKFTYWLK